MRVHETIGEALDDARAALKEPVDADDRAAGWDEDHCLNWLKAVDAIERYISGDETERGFSIVRSLDSHGSDTMDHPRGRALMKLAAVLRQNGINHFA